MHLSPDEVVFWQQGYLKLNLTIAMTWVLIIVLVAGSHLITRRLSVGLKISRWQNLLEIVVAGVKRQIEEVGLRQPEKYLGFLGTLFLFIALTGMVQAYIFSILATVYIAAATRTRDNESP